MSDLTRSGANRAMLVQFAVELFFLFAAGVLLIRFRGSLSLPVEIVLIPALVFALLIAGLNVAFGLYGRSERLTSGGYLVRVVLAPAIGVPLAYLIAELLPHGQLLQENLSVKAVVFAVGGLLLLRHVVVLPLVGWRMPYRILVLGTGDEARMVEASLHATNRTGIELAGFYALDKVQDRVVSPGHVIEDSQLDDLVSRLHIDEIIVAVRQQRGGVLPLRALLDCRLRGVEVTDLARFFERVHGRVPIESLKVSWLIYGEGYRQGWLRTFVKRTFDLAVSITLLVLAAPVMIMAAALILFEGGGPIVYRQERVGRGGRTFTLFKFRTMSRDAEKDGKACWAAVNDARITRVGKVLRRSRIDELPQLLNVMRGEMSFVGPRPERPEFVAMLTDQIPFYAVRHSVKPGLTGWAQVRYSYGATIEQSVKKLEYDLYYVKNHTLFLDVLVLLETVRVVLLGEGAR